MITPSGREQVFVRGRGRMVLVRDEQASYEVGPRDPEETAELRDRSETRAWAFQHDSPEYIFRQEEPAFEDRLMEVALEFNLASDLPVSKQIDQVLNLMENNSTSFTKAAAIFFDIDESIEALAGEVLRFKRLLLGALPYWKTAEETGVDPGLLAQLVLWETPHWSRLWEHNFELAKLVGANSFGVAQIQPGTAIDMITSYRDKFADFEPEISSMQIDNQSWDEDKVGWALFSNKEFSIRVAGVYLAYIRKEIDSDMQDYTVQITDGHAEDPRSISGHQRQMLTAIGYNQGLNQAVERLAIRYTDGVESAIRDAIGQGFIPEVLPPDGLQSELEAELKYRGVTVSNEKTDKAHIRPSELELLTRVANVRGLDQLLDDVDRAGAVNVVAGVKNILSVNDYDDNVLGRKQDAVDSYGLSYEGDRDEG